MTRRTYFMSITDVAFELACYILLPDVMRLHFLGQHVLMSNVSNEIRVLSYVL